MSNKFYIFLDIDGVLATTRQFFSKKRHEEWNCYNFDAKCVRVFNEILERTKLGGKEPVVILSSDWKTHYKIETMNNIMAYNNAYCVIEDYTPNLCGVKFKSAAQLEDCRADEILKYVHEHDIEDWVAIDDLDLSPWISEKHFVCTPQHMEGIKQSGVKDKILKLIL